MNEVPLSQEEQAIAAGTLNLAHTLRAAATAHNLPSSGATPLPQTVSLHLTFADGVLLCADLIGTELSISGIESCTKSVQLSISTETGS